MMNKKKRGLIFVDLFKPIDRSDSVNVFVFRLELRPVERRGRTCLSRASHLVSYRLELNSPAFPAAPWTATHCFVICFVSLCNRGDPQVAERLRACRRQPKPLDNALCRCWCGQAALGAWVAGR